MSVGGMGSNGAEPFTGTTVNLNRKDNNTKKSFGKRALDRAKYVGKNFWKVLPVGSAINYADRIQESTKDTPIKYAFHSLYGAIGVVILGAYTLLGLRTDSWTPAQIKQYNEKRKIINQMEVEHKREVDYFYNRMFEDAKTFQDSVDVYKHYNLPIILPKITFKQKEEAIKQNQLEKSVR